MNRCRSLSLAALCVVLAFPLVAQAGGGWEKRPLDDFLGAQGTTSVFVPPVPDYVGWVDADFITFALVDYAGLANAFIESETGGAQSLGTRVRGTVRERAKPDGRAEVRVQLETRNALSWAFLIEDVDFSDPLFFLNTPLSFGARAQDVVGAGAEPALGRVEFDLTFMNSAPGAPLPDLVQLINAPEPGQTPLMFSFRAQACGAKPDGTPARLRIRQVCSITGSDQVCTTEIVEIQEGAVECDDD
jgi:hypothetical protein